jgi:hypothetical protein
MEKLAGIAGIGILQSWMLPAIVQAAKIGAGPPVASCLLMITGFILLSVHSIKTRAHLYTICNGVGIVGNITMIGFLL